LLPLNGDSEYKVPAKVWMEDKYWYTWCRICPFEGVADLFRDIVITMVCTEYGTLYIVQPLSHINISQGADPLPPSSTRTEVREKSFERGNYPRPPLWDRRAI
jgi:hypothetical protein